MPVHQTTKPTPNNKKNKITHIVRPSGIIFSDFFIALFLPQDPSAPFVLDFSSFRQKPPSHSLTGSVNNTEYVDTKIFGIIHTTSTSVLLPSSNLKLLRIHIQPT